jgi:mannose-6-phosphate isomerase-like protein (cupin superfamily)
MHTTHSISAIWRTFLADQGLRIVHEDLSRPWGGFFVMDNHQAREFASLFFPEVPWEELGKFDVLSPKVLMVAPHQRLSWQYHHRRSEIWKCISDRVFVITSDDDTERGTHMLQQGDIIRLRQGERHRLVGADDWGVVAEIWQHVDPLHPSDEEDIVRVQDDFNRKS